MQRDDSHEKNLANSCATVLYSTKLIVIDLKRVFEDIKAS